LLLLDFATVLDALKYALTILVELQLVDDDVARVNTQRNGLTDGLLPNDCRDVNDVFETVDGSDLALATLVGTSDDGDFIIFSDGD